MKLNFKTKNESPLYLFVFFMRKVTTRIVLVIGVVSLSIFKLLLIGRQYTHKI